VRGSAPGLLEQLPAIVAAGRKAAAHALAGATAAPTTDANRLIHGDNLPVMAALARAGMAGKIDLIYVDPPFASNADYRAAGEFAYSDTWADGLPAYLAMLTPRLVLMRELLAETGSIYVHLDWHVGHYVKIILDEIFGRARFRNDIIWHYENKLGTGWSGHTFDSRHDILFLYSKTSSVTHTAIREPVRQQKPQPVTQKVDGKRVWLRNEDGSRQYRLGAGERPVGDVWHIPIINPVAAERLGYATQKPEALLERVIRASSREGALVADFFAGTGTTAAVAERLCRRWIAVDSGAAACRIARRRLLTQQAKPFVCDVREEAVAPFSDQRRMEEHG
jgi:DNA modification methylase